MSSGDDQDKLALRLRLLQDNLASLSARLDSSLQLLSAISALTVVPLHATSLAQAAREMLGILVQGIENIMNCSIMLYEPSGDQLRILAVQGQAEFFGEDVDGGVGHLTFKPGEGIAGRVYAEGQPTFWSNASGEDDEVKMFTDSQLPPAIACLPLYSQDACLGVLNLSFAVPMKFTFVDQRDLVLLSQVVANILQTFVLREELNAR